MELKQNTELGCRIGDPVDAIRPLDVSTRDTIVEKRHDELHQSLHEKDIVQRDTPVHVNITFPTRNEANWIR